MSDAGTPRRVQAGADEDPVAHRDTAMGDWTREAVEASPDGIVIVDAGGWIVAANPALAALSGRPQAELLGKPLEVLLPDDLRGLHRRLREEYRARATPRPMGAGVRLEMLRADGSELPVEVALAPLASAARGTILATVRDVSDRRAEEAALARLAGLLDLVPDGIVVVDLDARVVTEVNHAATDLLGYERAELVGMPVARLQPPAAEGGGPDHPALLSDGRRLHRQSLLTRDGTLLACEVHATRVDGPDGSHLVNVVRDVRERMALEERVRTSEATLRAIFEQVPVGIAITRVESSGRRTVERTNSAFTTVFGYPDGALSGTDPAALWAAEDLPRADSLSGRALGGELTEYAGVRRFVRRDGTAVWVDTAAVRMGVDENGTRFLVRVVDITKRLDAQRATARAATVTQCVADVARAALERRPEGVVFERIATGVMESLEAETAALLLVGTENEVGHEWGAAVGELAGPLAAALETDTDGTLLTLLTPRTAFAVPTPSTDLPEPFVGSAGPLAVTPFGTDESPPFGALVACRAPGRDPFDPTDLEVLARLAGETQVALHLSRARADQQRLSVLEERQRIARELHDTVIQDVIAIGMQISADIDAETDPARQERDLERVTQLEGVTRNLRRAVFELRSSTHRSSTATDVTDAVSEATRMLGHVPAVIFTGPVDEVPEPVAGDLLAALREALVNVARHADARTTAVSVTVAEGVVTLTVDDDGVGPPPHRRTGYGLGYVEDRARRHGGRLFLGPGPVVGTRFVWSCPLEPRS